MHAANASTAARLIRSPPQEVVRNHLRGCHETPFFPHCTGRRYSASAHREAFHQTFDLAGIARVSGGQRRSRLAPLLGVLRLTLWCEQDVDLGAKLLLLATYLGHVGLASSQRYLQLTQDLVAEVTRRHQARFGQARQEDGEVLAVRSLRATSSASA